MATAAYPGALRVFTDKVDEQDIVEAAHVNLLQEEMEAVQSELGLTPSGTHDTVAAFLTNLNTVKYQDNSAIKAAAGTVAAPGHGFNAETGLGMFRPAPGTLGFAASGGEVMRLTSAGASLATMEVTSALTVTGTTTGIDHGALTGLSDNADHPQFSLLDGTRAFTGPVGGVAPTNPTHLTTKAYVDARFPTGSVVFTGRTTAPDGWLLCEGQTVDKATYSALFDAIGTAYGPTSTTTFSIPDLRQRFPLGKAATGTGSILGAVGGAIDHVHGNPDVSTVSSHVHSNVVTDYAGTHAHSNPSTGYAGGHAHNLRYSTIGTTGTLHSSTAPSGSTSSLRHYEGSGTDTTSVGDHRHTTSNTNDGGNHRHGTSNTQGAGGHSHTQPNTETSNPPYLVLNAMIKT